MMGSLGRGAEGRVGCTEELSGTHLPKRVEAREGEEGVAVLLLDPAAVRSAHVRVTHVVPFGHVHAHALPPASRPPAPHASPAPFSPRRGVWLWSGLP